MRTILTTIGIILLMAACRDESDLIRHTSWKLESYAFISETSFHTDSDSTNLYSGLVLNFQDGGVLDVKTDAYSVKGHWENTSVNVDNTDNGENDPIHEASIWLEWTTPSGQLIQVDGQALSITKNKMDFRTPVEGTTSVDPKGYMLWRFERK